MRRFIHAADSWEDADASFESFVATMPERRAQLRARLEATGGPSLDRGLEGLDDLNAWYLCVGLEDQPDGMDWWPAWIGPEPADWEPNSSFPRRRSPQVARLWEMIAVHLGDLMLEAIPQSRWVCWRSKHPMEMVNGMFVMDVGHPSKPGRPVDFARAGVMLAVQRHGTGGPRDELPGTTTMTRHMVRTLAEVAEYRSTGKRLAWQRAPTGPDAHRKTTVFPGGSSTSQ